MDMHSGLIARNVSDEEKQFYNIDTQSVENGVASATSTTAVTTTAVSTAAVTASATTTSIATTAVEVKQVEVIGQVSIL